MKECRISGDMVIGNVCRLIPGNDSDACYLLREVQSEPSLEGIKRLESLCSRLTACQFQNDVMWLIKEKTVTIQRNGH